MPSKNYVDNKFNDPSIIKNTNHVNFNDKYFNNVRMVRVNELPEWKNDLTPKFYSDKALSDVLGYVNGLQESSRNERDLSSVLNDQDKEFDNNKLTNLDSITVNRNPNLDNELANKKYIDDELDKTLFLDLIKH